MYGGSHPHDFSGVVCYRRIEFAGIAFAQDSEINGLTFGGTVRVKHVMSRYNVDDNFDTDFGFAGSIQSACAERDKNIFDGVQFLWSPRKRRSAHEGDDPYSLETFLQTLDNSGARPTIDRALSSSWSLHYGKQIRIDNIPFSVLPQQDRVASRGSAPSGPKPRSVFERGPVEWRPRPPPDPERP
jgi:hypothetical protein